MRVGAIDTAKSVLVVAEIGNNHEGDFAVAQEMLGRAVEAGADAVKFQTFVPELYVSSAEPERLARLRSFRLSIPQFEALAREAARAGVVFISTPFDLESARALNEFQTVFKIASGDNTFHALVDTVAAFGKPMIVSTGLADLSAIEGVYARVLRIWKAAGLAPGLALLHCVSAYPVPHEQANLGAISALRARFSDAVIGFSDHTLGIEAATYAVAAGARIIEKHFTLDTSRSGFRDHGLSADPAEFRRLVAAIRRVEAMLGSGELSPQACERESQVAARRSIAAAVGLAAGTAIREAHLTWVRPGAGLPPGQESALLGRVLARALGRGELITPDDLV
jgi:sialic acid synthase SpsE